MKIKLTLPNAKVPLRANPTDAGADLFSPVDILIPNDYSKFIDFGVQLEIPAGYVGLIFARSSLGGKGIRPMNCVGVIDSKYRGNIGMNVENASDVDYHIGIGDRIAQLVILPIVTPEFEVVDELDMEGDRGGGFGSTGLNSHRNEIGTKEYDLLDKSPLKSLYHSILKNAGVDLSGI